MELILASNSPRRKELLTQNGIKFSVIKSDYEERNFTDDPIETAVEFARGKANSVYNSLLKKDDKIVLGADTVVYHNGKILGKAKDKEQAINMLKSLSGKTHLVITGYAFVGKNVTETGFAQSEVTFNLLSDDLIIKYVNSGLYEGKAGSYGIQDGYGLVEKYTGSLDNVIGLPTEIVVPLINKILEGKK